MYKANKTKRIYAKDCYVSTDTRETQINNNSIVAGVSGAGKTRSFVKVNLLEVTEESLIVADTKGNLMEEVGSSLEKRGYRLIRYDFKDMNRTTARWNPLQYISYDKKRDCYSETDIWALAEILIPDTCTDDPFWYSAAKQYFVVLLSYVMDFLPENEHSLKSVFELFRLVGSDDFGTMMEEIRTSYPNSTTGRNWDAIRNNTKAEKMDASIKGILSSYLDKVVMDPAIAMYEHPNEFRFRDCGKEKIAIFLVISDSDRSMDNLISLFYKQALQDLLAFADLECEGQRLPVPTYFLLDDFCTNCKLKDCSGIISIIRSREIYMSLIIQSISQLYALYGDYEARNIMNNCDSLLYLGGTEPETISYVANRANVPEADIWDMATDEAYLFIRGQKAKKVEKYDITQHPRYNELAEAQEDTPPKDAKTDVHEPKKPSGREKG